MGERPSYIPRDGTSEDRTKTRHRLGGIAPENDPARRGNTTPLHHHTARRLYATALQTPSAELPNGVPQAHPIGPTHLPSSNRNSQIQFRRSGLAQKKTALVREPTTPVAAQASVRPPLTHENHRRLAVLVMIFASGQLGLERDPTLV